MTISYEQSELIHKIREEYGTTDRSGNPEGNGTAATGLQNKFRDSESEGGQSIGHPEPSGKRATRNNQRTEGIERPAKRSYRRKGRTGATPDESDSSTNRRDRSDNRTVPTAAVSGDTDEKEDKPSGLDLKPNAIERKVRQEKAKREAEEQNSSAKKDLFGWIRPDNRGKQQPKEPLRSKPLSDKEAEEIRPRLQAALIDYFRIADEVIYATNKKGNHVVIWSAIDDEDAGVLVDVWLARAKTNVKTANHVVFAVQKHDELRVGIILVPKFYQTFRAYVDGGGFGVHHEAR